MVEQGIESGVETTKYTMAPSFLCFFTLYPITPHNQRTQCRRERQGIEERDTHGNSHRQSELRIECSRDTADEADWHKDGHKHQRRGDKRRGDVVHRRFCK